AVRATATAQPKPGIRPIAPATALLTLRELEILRLLQTSMRNREIADHLGVVSKTVEFHMANIFAKLGARTRVEAVLMAHDLGLLSEGPAPAPINTQEP